MRQAYNDLLDFVGKIERDWRVADNTCAVFPEIVLKHSQNYDLSAFGDLSRLPELLDIAAIAKLQQPSNFSDVHVNLYNNGRFLVEVLNWWGSDINIHDHDFSGVQFQLAGKSLNVVYQYNGESSSDRVCFGSMNVQRAELWRPGGTSIVLPGRAEPHNVQHLSIPTVSLLVRTAPTPAYGPQRNYFPPSVSADYGVADIIFRKKISALRVLSRGSSNEFHRALNHTISTQTLTESLFTLVKLIDIIFGPDHSSFLREFSSLSPKHEEITRCVANHKTADFLTNHLKHAGRLDHDEILCAAILGSSFNQASCNAIVHSLNTGGYHFDFAKVFDRLCSKLPTSTIGQLENALAILGINPSRVGTYGIASTV